MLRAVDGWAFPVTTPSIGEDVTVTTDWNLEVEPAIHDHTFFDGRDAF